MKRYLILLIIALALGLMTLTCSMCPKASFASDNCTDNVTVAASVNVRGSTINRCFNYDSTSYKKPIPFPFVWCEELEVRNVTATNITHNSAVINWETTEPTKGRIRYGNYLYSIDEKEVSIQHSLELRSLDANTKYEYYIVTEGICDAVVTFGSYSFMTTKVPKSVNIEPEPVEAKGSPIISYDPANNQYFERKTILPDWFPFALIGAAILGAIILLMVVKV